VRKAVSAWLLRLGELMRKGVTVRWPERATVRREREKQRTVRECKGESGSDFSTGPRFDASHCLPEPYMSGPPRPISVNN
jgi:hypothetical protein